MRRATSWVVACLTLHVAWMIACERFREQAPAWLAAFLVIVWAPAAAAWLVELSPPGRRVETAVRLAAVLALATALVDVASPYPRRFTFVGWELLRAASILAMALPALARVSATRAGMRVARALRWASCALFVVAVAVVAHVGRAGARDEASPADAALVLGFALDDQGRPRPQIIGRVDRAVELLRSGVVPTLVLSGGVERGGHSEATVMRDLALERGAAKERLVLEQSSRSTIENFACGRSVLATIGARSILVVTEPWHMTRALLLARRHGLDARGAPASSAIWRSPRYAAYWLFRDAVAFSAEVLRNPWAAPGRCDAPVCEGCRSF